MLPVLNPGPRNEHGLTSPCTEIEQTCWPAPQVGLVAVIVPTLAYSLSRFTHHLLAAPLVRLQEGIRAVENGRLDPIQVTLLGVPATTVPPSATGVTAATPIGMVSVTSYEPEGTSVSYTHLTLPTNREV